MQAPPTRVVFVAELGRAVKPQAVTGSDLVLAETNHGEVGSRQPNLDSPGLRRCRSNYYENNLNLVCRVQWIFTQSNSKAVARHVCGQHARVRGGKGLLLGAAALKRISPTSIGS